MWKQDTEFLADIICYLHNKVRTNSTQAKKDLELFSKLKTYQILEGLLYTKL